MIRMTLAELADAVGGTLEPARGDTGDTTVAGVVDTDSREIGPGDIFVAKPGEVTDGHLFVGAAAEAGAALALTEHRVDAQISQIIVPDVVQALADLARTVVARVRAAGISASSGSRARTAKRRPRTSSSGSSRTKARRSPRGTPSTTTWARRSRCCA